MKLSTNAEMGESITNTDHFTKVLTDVQGIFDSEFINPAQLTVKQ